MFNSCLRWFLAVTGDKKRIECQIWVFSLIWVCSQKKRLNSVKHADSNGTRLIEAGNAMRRLLSSEETRAVCCPFLFCYFINSNENDSAKVTISCKNLFSLCDNIEVTIFLLRLFPSPIIGSHHRGWRQTWQKIRWRVMCLPVVLEVSWLWSTKMESFLMLSLHSRYLLSHVRWLCPW